MKISSQLANKFDYCSTEFRHSRMFLAGIQAKPELDPRLERSGVTPLRLLALSSDIQQFSAERSIPPLGAQRLRGEIEG